MPNKPNSLLLHICCGPCLLYPIQVLKNKDISVVGFFYNPNIHPYQEFRLRMGALEKVATLEGVEIIWDRTYGLELFLEEVLFLKDRPKRCERCYYLRLRETAKKASLLKMDAFSTTLLYSPFQYHELIREIGEELEVRFKISFYYEDWRVGYLQGKQRSLELEIYRQKYCGCIFSEKERFLKKSSS